MKYPRLDYGNPYGCLLYFSSTTALSACRSLRRNKARPAYGPGAYRSVSQLSHLSRVNESTWLRNLNFTGKDKDIYENE